MIPNLFREKFKFCGFTQAFQNFCEILLLSVRHLNISRNKLYIFRTSKNGLNFDYFAEIAHKIAKLKHFSDIYKDSDSPINYLSDDI